MNLHPNTIWLMEWADRMNKKYGPPESGYDWCRKLAYYMGEQGNDHPTYIAIGVAKQWEISHDDIKRNTNLIQTRNDMGDIVRAEDSDSAAD